MSALQKIKYKLNLPLRYSFFKTIIMKKANNLKMLKIIMDKKNLLMYSCQYSVNEIGGQWYQHRNNHPYTLKQCIKTNIEI